MTEENAYQALFNALSTITFPSVNGHTSFVIKQRRNIADNQVKPEMLPALFQIQGIDQPEHAYEKSNGVQRTQIETILKPYIIVWLTTGTVDTFPSILANGVHLAIKNVIKPFLGQETQRLGGNVVWVAREKTVFGEHISGKIIGFKVFFKMKIIEGNE